jgi:hypothetical protein
MKADWHIAPDGNKWLRIPNYADKLHTSPIFKDLDLKVKTKKQVINGVTCKHVREHLGNVHLICEFEHALVFSHIGDAMSLAKNSFGRLLGVSPEPEPEPTGHPDTDRRISYVMLDSNPHVKKMITRNEYKLLVGSALVMRATAANWSTSRKNGMYAPFRESVSDEELIALTDIQRTPQQFWQDCKNGNIEHAALVARDTPLRRKRQRSKAHYLRDEQCAFFKDRLTQGELDLGL